MGEDSDYSSSMKRKKGGQELSAFASFKTIFMHADATDMWLMALGLLGAIGDGLTMPLIFANNSHIMNDLGNGPSSSSSSSSGFTHNVNQRSLNLIYFALGSWVANFFEGYCWTRTAERQASRMRARYLKAVLRQDVEYFDLHGASTTEVITSVSSDSLVIQDVLSEKVPNFVMNVSTFVGSYVVGLVLIWRLVLVALPTALLLLVPGVAYGRMLVGLTRGIQEEYVRAGSIAEQAVAAVRTVYSFTGEARTMAEFSAALEGSVRLGIRLGLAKGIAIGSNGVTFAIWALLAWYGSRLVMYHGSQGGTILSMGVNTMVGGLSLGLALSNVKYFAEASSAGQRIMEVIKRVPKIDSESEEGEVLESVSGEVEFREVEFAYPSRPESAVFKGFSLRVPAGKTVALVGGSGSGKSTAIVLLERFYDPASGKVLLDGVDIRKLRLRWLRSQMGLVSQEPALFATSIKENILFGKEGAAMEEVVAAAKAANAHGFISQLPHGYDTQVGERGVQMSGGQKQRIAIARAILRSPKILLLDEATSALDSESERVVQDALDLASLGRTTIVIAHRLSTVRHAHLIAVVSSGRVAESGPHDDLILRHDGLYSSLVRLQVTSTPSTLAGPTAATSAALASGGSSHSMSRRLSAASRTSSARSWAPPEEPKQAKPVPSFRRMLMLNAPEWRQAMLGCLSAMAAGAIQPLYAFALGGMISVFFAEDHGVIKDKTRTYCLVFVSMSVFSFLVNFVQHYNFGVMGEHLTKRLRERMLSKMLTFEVGWFDQDENSTGAICSRLAKDANVVRSLVGDRMSLLIQTLMAVVLACAMGLAIAWRLAAVMIAVQPLIIACFYLRRVLLRSMTTKAVESQAQSGKLAAEAVSNFRTVTAFSSQPRILRLLELAQAGPRRENIRQSWFAGTILGTAQALMALTWALNFWYAGRLVSQGRITSKGFFQTFLILMTTGRAIADAGSTTTADLAKGANAVSSVFAVLDRYTMIDPEDPDGQKLEKLDGDIDIRGVDFAYPARSDVIVFRGFSLTIEAGRSTALVGKSGSGKSTIIGLIERFYDPIRGSIRIDGKDIRWYHLRSLRQHIALVGQEPALFAGTVRENIAYGAGGSSASTAEVEAAARAANAHDFIASLKDGYDTWCGVQGAQLSGGQKQRIAIARAILRRPAILLLDEATSALDGQSEKVVQEALERVMVGRTSVVVAHRLSTIRNCHLIAVLEQGAVVEKGTHDSLLARGPTGSYYGLVRLQQGHKERIE